MLASFNHHFQALFVEMLEALNCEFQFDFYWNQSSVQITAYARTWSWISIMWERSRTWYFPSWRVTTGWTTFFNQSKSVYKNFKINSYHNIDMHGMGAKRNSNCNGFSQNLYLGAFLQKLHNLKIWYHRQSKSNKAIHRFSPKSLTTRLSKLTKVVATRLPPNYYLKSDTAQDVTHHLINT